VEAVEIPERDDGAAQGVGDWLGEGQALHYAVIARSEATKQSILA
jgi:hypothetical protein